MQIIILCTLSCACSILIILNQMYIMFWVSLIILFGCLFTFLGVSLLFCNIFKPFVETETHLILFPQIQCVIGVLFVLANMLFYSNVLSSFLGIRFFPHDYVCYYANLIIGVLLILATRTKRIIHFQLVHIIILPIFFVMSLSFSERVYLDVAIYILLSFSIFHAVMSDKRIVSKFQKTMKNLKHGLRL